MNELYGDNLTDYFYSRFNLRIPLIPYHPCIKYKIPADRENDGTDAFIMTESMQFEFGVWWQRAELRDSQTAFL